MSLDIMSMSMTQIMRRTYPGLVSLIFSEGYQDPQHPIDCGIALGTRPLYDSTKWWQLATYATVINAIGALTSIVIGIDR